MTDLLFDLRSTTVNSEPSPAVAPASVSPAVAPTRRQHSQKERHEHLTDAIGVIGAVVLFGVTVLGAIHSYDAVRRGAEQVFGQGLLAGTFPFLADGVIAGATFRYVSLLRRGRYVPGWRLLAHSGIAATVYLNAAVATTVGQIPWHVVAPAGFSILIELWAKEAVGDLQELTGARRDPIPLWLWITDTRLARRTRMQMVRTGGTSFVDALAEVHRIDVALEVLHLALPGEDKQERATRARLARWIRHGVLPTASVLDVAGLNDPDLDPMSLPPAECLLRATFSEVLTSAEPVAAAPTPTPTPARVSAPVQAPAQAPAPVRAPAVLHTPAPVRAPAVLPATQADLLGDGVLPRAMTEAEKTALRWAARELTERGERITASAVQAHAACTVPSVALRTKRAINNYLRSSAASAPS